MLWATGELTDYLTTQLTEFEEYLDPQEMCFRVNPDQHLTAALEYSGQKAAKWDEAEDKAATFSRINDDLFYVASAGSSKARR